VRDELTACRGGVGGLPAASTACRPSSRAIDDVSSFARGADRGTAQAGSPGGTRRFPKTKPWHSSHSPSEFIYDLQTEAAPDDAVTDLTVAVVGGGGRGWTSTLMNDLAQCPSLHGTIRLYDVVYENALENERLWARYDGHPDARSDWTYEAVEDLDAALSGADFVVCSTQAETMKHDLDLPAEHGIHQSVGDTVGPGGVLRSMRSVPQYLEIGRAVRDNCPDAWVLNYTNPMTVCTHSLYEAYPDINAIGLCHEVFGTQGHFASLANEYLDLDEEARSDEVDLNVEGINHFTWVDEARYDGRDLLGLPDRELAEKALSPSSSPATSGMQTGSTTRTTSRSTCTVATGSCRLPATTTSRSSSPGISISTSTRRSTAGASGWRRASTASGTHSRRSAGARRYSRARSQSSSRTPARRWSRS
jgi:hypothetical protein